MEIDKRPFYVWIVTLLPHIGIIFITLLVNILERHHHLFKLRSFIPLGIVLGIVLLMSVVPVLISGSESRLKNRFGYGIPILLLLPLPYFIYDSYTCTDMFCLGPVLFGGSLIISAVIFALFYAMGIYARKWNVKFVLSLLWIEIILLIGSALYFGFNDTSVLTI